MAASDRRDLLVQFWQDERLSAGIKIEDMLLVAEGLRPASLLIVPVNLPDGDRIGRDIDRRFYHAWNKGYMPDSPRWSRPLEYVYRRIAGRVVGSIRYRASLAREAFRKTVADSPGYKALVQWSEALGIERLETTVRPTIDEVYLSTGAAVVEGLGEVMGLRYRARQETGDGDKGREALVFRAFPEERDRSFLTTLGRLLGYPSCCVERYADERVGGINVEERAARQLRKALSRGRVAEHAYYSRDFFPCQPDCPRASGKGKAGLRILRRLGEQADLADLGEAYLGLMQDNMNLVKEYPELIRSHEKAMKEKRGGGRISRDEHE